MTATRPAPTRAVPLPDDLLERARSRAHDADRDNAFFTEDLAELRSLGYLTAAVPEHRGGWGYDLETLALEQRRLARHAPATALALSMHSYWVGLAADFERMGNDSLTWILDEAANGKIFAAGHGEAGNDMPIFFSPTRAERVDGGYRLSGRKNFGSLGPVWDYIGFHATDFDAPGGPQVVHGFMPRATDGVTVVETWNTLGMRPTQSHDTVFENAFVADRHIGAVVPQGDSTADFTGVMSVWALSLISNVYLGIAERALELAVRSATTKKSMANPREYQAYNPFVQHQIADMYIDVHAARVAVERFTTNWVSGELAEDLPAKLFATKWLVVESAKRVVDRALDVSGGGAMFKGNELERLYRDVRCGGFHPGSDALTHELVGKIALGIAGEDGPRW